MYPAYIIAIIFFIIVLIFLGRSSISRRKHIDEPQKNKQIIKNARKQLLSNPQDARALLELAKVFFEDQDWENTFENNGTLIELVNEDKLMATKRNVVDLTTIKLHYGIAAFHLDKLTEAFMVLTDVIANDKTLFEANYYLGMIKYKQSNYQLAFELLNNAIILNPDSMECMKHLGITLSHLNKYVRAETFLREVHRRQSNDPETMFYLAKCYFELRQLIQAEKILEKIRTDPTYGPPVALMAGNIHLSQQKVVAARKALEYGLSYQNIQQQLKVELQYQLATVLMQLQQVGKANELFRSLYKDNPDYKDVAEKVHWLQELLANEHLQTYLVAEQEKFITVCRKLCKVYFKNSRIMNIQFHTEEYADILVHAEHDARHSMILIRFVRNAGIVGDIILRDMNSFIQESKASRGICFCASSYSETARNFAQARFITLVAKPGLLKALGKITLANSPIDY